VLHPGPREGHPCPTHRQLHRLPRISKRWDDPRIRRAERDGARDPVCWEIGLKGDRVCFGVGFDVGARAKQKGDASDSVPRFQMEWGNLQKLGPTK
jgi:hypothetical protein